MRRPLALLLAAALLLPAVARADGDPPSDILLAQDVYFPYSPNQTSKPLQQALKLAVQRAKAAGFATKVAIVASAGDLGSAAPLINDAQKYADLLTSEISFNVRDGKAVAGARVLVVLPGAIGGDNLGDHAGTALGDLVPPLGPDGDGLARTAITALERLATADGKPFALPPLPSAAVVSAAQTKAKKKGGGVTAAVIVGAPVLVLVLVGAVLARRPDPDAAES